MLNVNLENKKVILTGGSRGIGLSILKKLYSLNSQILIIGSNKENLDRVKKYIPIFLWKFLILVITIKLKICLIFVWINWEA